MPIYEYRCSSCGHDLEVLQKFSDPVLTTCPSCHAEALVKRVSAAGFQLKGSGWYVTDFRGGGKPPAKETKANGGSTADKSKADDAKSEAKTEAKTETKSDAGSSAAPAGTSTPSSSS